MLYDKNPCYDNYDMKFLVPESAVPVFEMALEGLASALLTRQIEKGKDKGKWEVQAIFEEQPDSDEVAGAMKFAAETMKIKMPKYQITPMPHKNWLKESLISFPPVTIGKYYIYGSHVKETPPADKISLLIDAATAFGSGEHQTTQGCLKAMEHITKKFKPESVLDVGCGSGILAMAYAKTYLKKVDAVDIDPESVWVTSNSAKENSLQNLITVWESDGYQKVEKSYDLILCNILANPLIAMAKDLNAHLNAGGIAILSGFIYDQEDDVLKAHTDLGLKFIKKYHVKGWTTLVVGKN